MPFRVLAFSLASFVEEVKRACKAGTEWEAPDQIKYLHSFLMLHDMAPKLMVVEEPYVDRHYLEEFTGYYATALYPPPSKATRIHFLTDALKDDWLSALLCEASANYEKARRRLNEAYVGYMVARPIPSAPVGRTVLRPYSRDGGRCFGPRPARNHAHFAGIEVVFEGVPFQQQDLGVGACATTALWSALAKVARNDGVRPATPLAVTEAATRHVASGRVFPAGGLDLQQMVAAIRLLNYSPHVFQPDEPDLFKATLSSYVRSGIPVVLQLKIDGDTDSHAVAVVGVRENEPDEAVTEFSEVSVKVKQEELRFAPLTRLYVHDDRLGPYAKMRFVPPPADAEGKPKSGVWLMLDPSGTSFEKFKRPAFVRQAIAPLYPKLRVTVEDLLTVAAAVAPVMKAIAPETASEFQLEARFVLGGEYQRECFEKQLSPERLAKIADLLLSRYVGVVTFSQGKTWLGDIVCDSTDIRRDVPRYGSLLAFIPNSESTAKNNLTLFGDQAPQVSVI